MEEEGMVGNPPNGNTAGKIELIIQPIEVSPPSLITFLTVIRALKPVSTTSKTTEVESDATP